MQISDLAPSFKRYILTEKGLSKSYFQSISYTLKMLDSYSKGSIIKSFNSNNLRRFLFDMKEDRAWSAKTFRINRGNLCAFFEWCNKRGYINKNPITSIECPKLEKRLPRCLSKNQISILLGHLLTIRWRSNVQRIRNETIIFVFLLAGIRLSELLNLQLTDVNLEQGFLLIRQGKGKKDRMVPIHPKLDGILKKYIELKSRKMKPSLWFFTGCRSDKKLRPKDIHHLCHRLVLESGIYFTPHILRHTFAHLSVEADLSFYKLKEILGHSDIQTTMIYASVSPESIRKSFCELHLI